MPRVNRDLQRRLAARRDRDRRRRPAGRRYQFGPSAETGETTDGRPAEATATAEPAPQTRWSEATARAPRTGQARLTPKAFSEYRAEYAYVAQDLRRIAVVVSVLLVVLFALWLLFLARP